MKKGRRSCEVAAQSDCGSPLRIGRHYGVYRDSCESPRDENRVVVANEVSHMLIVHAQEQARS